MQIEIKTANSDQEIVSCWEVMLQLRPMLKKDEFVSFLKLLQSEGYVLNYIEQDGKPVALAGFRFKHMLLFGKMIYVDDLVTLEEYRGKGLASVLLKNIENMAQKNKCKSVQLDSGITNTGAHKLYHKEGFANIAFHFIKTLD